MNASSNPNYEHTGLSPTTKYTYQVRSVDINGAGDWSGAASATTRSTSATAGQLPKVTGLTVTDATGDNTAASRTARLAWNAVSGVTHYEIMVFDPSAGTPDWARVAAALLPGETAGFITKAEAKSPPTVDLTIATGTDGGSQGRTYYYIVSAVHAGPGVNPTPGNADDDMGEWSDYKSVTFKDFKPKAPTALSATKTTGTSIWLSWTQPAGVPGETPRTGTATSYNLQWRTGQSSTWSNIAVSGTTYHHTGLSGSTSYTYRVRAQNSGGESAYFPASTATQVTVPLGNTLPAPSGVKAGRCIGEWDRQDQGVVERGVGRKRL